MSDNSKLTKYFIIGTFVSLYILVSIISTIHVIEFFELSNPRWLAITLAIAFEIGAAASLASIIALDKMNKFVVWVLFFVLTAMQAMGNTFYAYVNLENYQPWVELFGLIEEEPIFQKRILSLVSGGILPLVALGFIKSLVDYMKPNTEEISEEKTLNHTTINDFGIYITDNSPVTTQEGNLEEPITDDVADAETVLPEPILVTPKETQIEPEVKVEEPSVQLEIPFDTVLEPVAEEQPKPAEIEQIQPQLEIPFDTEDSEKKN